MAKKNIYTGTIDKYTDWGGDVNTGYAPVAGESVQQFIKDTFDRKIGIFHHDVSKNQYLAFADEFTKKEYLDDPSKTNLILGHFDAPFNYTASINLISSYYNAVFLNSTGNYIDFTFDIVNKQSVSTGENVIITYTFIRNANKKTVTEIRKFGEVVHFNVDKYLEEGTNNIIIGITGQTTLAATTVAITYQVVNLFISDELNIAKSYNLSNGEKQLEVPFTVSGHGTKKVEWYIDGKLLDPVEVEDVVVDVSTTRTKYITLSKKLQEGTHSLQIRAYVEINGENFYTDTLYRDLLIYDGTSNDVIIGIATTIPREYGIIQPEEEVSIYEMIQYIPYSLRFATYSPSNAANTEVVVKLDGNILNTINSKNDVENEVIIVSKTSGNKTLELISGDISKNIVVPVKNTSINIHEIGGATIDFPSTGRMEEDKWTDGTYTGTFEGFNWNSTSGWVGGRLEMNAGSSLHINYAPLNNKPTNLGKTIEIEWSTKNVKNDNAIICDLRGNNGVGILITATKVSMISSNGEVIETEYKSEENVRIGFVINKSSGTANKRLSFIYINGILSRATQWLEYDNYNSDKEIVFAATEEAEISLKSIRIYDNALSSDNMLNNFILYRDTISEMMEVYTRNDIYEEGTTTFSPDKMRNRIPVMIVTGDIPILENTSNKNEQIVVDIEYYNPDPSKNFTMKNAAMRPQGTSSMYYPKKNFRIYTQELEDTKLYDHNGNLIESRLYSFKDKAQPVNCWCLKADYAESSGTHNTGIARLWNDALFNARVTHYFGKDDPKNIENQTVLRTEAQQKAINNNYEYDVRTTIDGFPILLFYKKNIDDDLIFIGKYNFNNDKSTESVFGFKDVPGFINSSMQCWEVLNNGNPLALFTSFDDFDNKWSGAFESRYPSENPKIEDLRAFCYWMVHVKEEDFAEQKWEHLDVYKMAAYWIYLMRHAAADQFVKNAMFTSEDGVHFYYILYDNDTINGLINSGYLTIKPTDDRQTKNAAGLYVFEGHDSKLWNYLEKDKEFLSIVASVDNALYSAGISYANTIKIFDENQADKWVERVYNQDAQYKYIGPYVEKGIDNLFMLQGKRDIHRKWWLAKRFSIYDAKYVSGMYKSEAIVLKLNGDEGMIHKTFSIKAGYPLEYGYGVNNIPIEYGKYLDVGETYDFEILSNLKIGDPLSIYSFPNISEIDLSRISNYIDEITINKDINNINSTKLTKLILGNPTIKNVLLDEISGLKQAEKLEELDIQNMTALTTIVLSNQKYFKKLKAYGSSVKEISFTPGAPVEHLELPSTMTSLILEQLPYLNYNKIYFEDNDISALSFIKIKSCPKISNNFSFIKQWIENKTTPDDNCVLEMDNIDWNGVTPDELVMVGQLGTIKLGGKVKLTEISEEYVNILSNLFGDNAFDKNSEFYIDVPVSLSIQGPTTLLEGESATYKLLFFGGELKDEPEWGFKSAIYGIQFNPTNQYLETIETGINRSITLTLAVETDKGKVTTELTVYVRARTYPSSSYTNIIGDSRLGESGGISQDGNILGGSIYELEITNNNDVNGEYYVEWILSGMEEYTTTMVIPENTHYCFIGITLYPDTFITGTITARIYKKFNDVLVFTTNKTIELINEDIAEIDPGICAAFYDNGHASNKSYIKKSEAAKITEEHLQTGSYAENSLFASYTDQIKSFKGFKYFTGVKKIKPYTFSGCASLESITIPNSVTSIGTAAFQDCSSLTSITIPNSVTTIGGSAFSSCDSLTSVNIPDSVTSIEGSTFYDCKNLTSITIPNSVTSIGIWAFFGCSNLKTITCKALTAPNVSSYTFGSSTSSYTGYNTRGQNVLLVPRNSSGYETGYWDDPLCQGDKCGFTLSKTL